VPPVTKARMDSAFSDQLAAFSDDMRSANGLLLADR
jgi:hypothetical protein